MKLEGKIKWLTENERMSWSQSRVMSYCRRERVTILMYNLLSNSVSNTVRKK